MIRAVDLCCGAGGWACASADLPIEWVAVADIDPIPLETWSLNHGRHHPGCQVLRCDLSTAEGVRAVLDATGKKKVDLVVGGIPCEQISIARAATPADRETIDALHMLIDMILGIVFELCPRSWAIEDVVQVVRHLPCPLFFGWDVPHRRIEARDFGPQDRSRSYLGNFPDPVPEPGPRTLGEVLLPGPWETVPRADSYERATNNRLYNDKIRVLDPSRPGPTVLAHMDRGSRQRRAYMVETPDGRLRRLGWQECAALQGFPSDYVFVGNRTEVDRQIGRAIPIHVGRAILKAVCWSEGLVRRERKVAV